MPNKEMLALGKSASVIREIFEYGKERRLKEGEDSVIDLSLGNPSAPPPVSFISSLLKHLKEDAKISLFGYTSGAGDDKTRAAVAEDIKSRFSFEACAENVYMTCGAAASLAVILNALCEKGDEVILLSPYFPEYKVFAEKAGAKVLVSPCRDGDFQPDISAISKLISEKTAAIIVNSPNNPTGAVYTSESIRLLAEELNKKQKELKRDIFIISDEPYRELCYTDTPPFIPNYYDNTVVCYSYSKSLSVPGERIGYILVSPRAQDSSDLFAAVCGAGRALGYVCAPSLMQKAVADCPSALSDISVYRENRDILYSALLSIGYKVTPPDGAFYMFIKTLEPDAARFCERAKK